MRRSICLRFLSGFSIRNNWAFVKLLASSGEELSGYKVMLCLLQPRYKKSLYMPLSIFFPPFNCSFGFLQINVLNQSFHIFLWMFLCRKTAPKAQNCRLCLNESLIQKKHGYYYFLRLVFDSISTVLQYFYFFFFLTRSWFKVPCGRIYDMKQNK